MKLFTLIVSLLFSIQLLAVNINTATQKELETLKGVGSTTAKAIIDYRSKHPFTSLKDIQNVRGIGGKNMKL